MAGGALGLSYTQQKAAKPLRFFLDYQFYLQMPFVKSYVPLLPNTLIHVGAAAPFSIFKSKSPMKNNSLQICGFQPFVAAFFLSKTGNRAYRKLHLHARRSAPRSRHVSVRIG